MKHAKTKTLDELALEEARALQSGLSLLRLEASEEEDEDEDEDEENEDEDEDEDEEEDDPPELGDAGKKALRKLREEKKALRRELKDAKKKTEDDSEREKREAVEEVEKRYHGMLARSAFRAALAEAGLTKGQKRLMKTLDLEDVEVDEDGEVSGVEDQVRALKKEFPELFRKGREGAGKGDGGAQGSPPGSGEKKSSAEKLAAQAQGD